MANSSFAEFVAEALAGLQWEYPKAHARIREKLGPRTVSMTIDSEHCHVTNTDSLVILPGRLEAPEVELSTSRPVIVDIANAKLSIEDAIWRDLIYLRGTVEDLVAFYDALQAFLHGAVRSPSSPSRLRRFTASTES